MVTLIDRSGALHTCAIGTDEVGTANSPPPSGERQTRLPDP